MTRPLALIFLLALGAGCSGPLHWYFSDEDQHHDWGYEGDIGPLHWAELSPDYRLAADGQAQSPIDLRTGEAQSIDLPPLTFRYHQTHAHWLNNGHTLQHNETDDNHLMWRGRRYDLVQYHVHTPSEHTLDGLHAAGELHFVHQGPDGEPLVVAVLVVAGEERADWIEEVESLPTQPGEEADLPHVQSPMVYLPEQDDSYWLYQGSFTTPPCTEGVTWIVLRTQISVPQEVLLTVQEILGRNNRPTMPLHGRVVQASNS